jgi:hypothetical protein
MSAVVSPSRQDRPPRWVRNSRALDHPFGWGDARTKEARFLKAYEERLLKHLGGEPTVMQTELVRRACRTALRLELLDVDLICGKRRRDPASSREYVSLGTQLIRTLRALGMAKTEAEQARLHEYLEPDDADGADVP